MQIVFYIQMQMLIFLLSQLSHHHVACQRLVSTCTSVHTTTFKNYRSLANIATLILEFVEPKPDANVFFIKCVGGHFSLRQPRWPPGVLRHLDCIVMPTLNYAHAAVLTNFMYFGLPPVALTTNTTTDDNLAKIIYALWPKTLNSFHNVLQQMCNCMILKNMVETNIFPDSNTSSTRSNGVMCSQVM